ncbi:MAG: hypothetical protein U0Y96_05700 [Candidatus Kapaibacterium sp.]
MLVILSDLHISDESTDRNVSPEAFTIFADTVINNSRLTKKKTDVTEIHIVLLGDIVDLVRTDYWLRTGVPLADRPWGEGDWNNLNPDTAMINDANKIEKQFNNILSNIKLTSCAKGLAKELQRIESAANKASIPFRVTYVIGNHDRVLWNFPKFRNDLAKFLLSNVKNISFATGILEQSYGVLARHGHEFTTECYSLDLYNEVLNKSKPNVPRFDPRLDQMMAIGEVITAELMSGFIWRLKDKIEEGERIKLMEVHTVRPFASAFLWIDWFMTNRANDGFKTKIIEALIGAIDDVLDSALAKAWDETVTDFIKGDITHYLGIIRGILSNTSLKWYDVMKKIVPILDSLGVFSEDDETFLEAAKSDFIFNSNSGINYVVYGHTHHALHHYIEGNVNGMHKTYINTGTYLPFTQKAEVNGFVSNHQMILLTFYSAAEDSDAKVRNTTSMDLWNGIKHKQYV